MVKRRPNAAFVSLLILHRQHTNHLSLRRSQSQPATNTPIPSPSRTDEAGHPNLGAEPSGTFRAINTILELYFATTLFLRNHITILIPTLNPSLCSLHCEYNIQKHYHPPALSHFFPFFLPLAPLTPLPLFKGGDRHRNHNHYHYHNLPTQVHLRPRSSNPETNPRQKRRGRRTGTLFCPIFACQVGGGAHVMARDNAERKDSVLARRGAQTR